MSVRTSLLMRRHPTSICTKTKNLGHLPAATGDDTASTEQFGYRKDSIYGCNDAEQQHNAMAGYYACITHVDHQIGRLLSALMESGEYDNTVILFLSDHGGTTL